MIVGTKKTWLTPYALMASAKNREPVMVDMLHTSAMLAEKKYPTRPVVSTELRLYWKVWLVREGVCRTPSHYRRSELSSEAKQAEGLRDSDEKAGAGSGCSSEQCSYFFMGLV
jgi:hypothetical protein